MLNKSLRTIWIINHYASTPDTGMGGDLFTWLKSFINKGIILLVRLY